MICCEKCGQWIRLYAPHVTVSTAERTLYYHDTPTCRPVTVAA